MLATVSHHLSATTPDDPNYEIRPSHWNSAHDVTLSLQSSDYPVFSAGTGSNYLSSVVFSNANGVSFGLSGSTITGTVATNYQSQGAYLTTAMQSNAATISNINISGGASSANVSAVTFSNANGVTFGYDKTNVTASINSTSGAGTGFTTTTVAGAVIAGTNNSAGLNLAVPAYLTTAMQSNAATISNINVSAGASSNNVSALTFSNANGVTFGYDKTNITASINSTSGAGTGFTTTTVAGAVIAGTNNSAGLNLAVPAYLTTADLSQNSSNYISAWSLAGAHTAGTTTSAAGTEIFFSGGNNITLSGNSNTIVISAGAGNSSVNFSAGANSANLGTVVFSNSNNVSFGLNGSTITASASNVGPRTLSRYVPFPLHSGSITTSYAGGQFCFQPVTIPADLAIQNVELIKSMNVSVPGATSQNSSGTEAWSYSLGMTVWTRQDWANNSTNISTYLSASGGLTAGMTYSSSSQSYKINWVTDTTGGTTSFSTTSASNNWSSYATGRKIFPIPFVTTLTAGEYFLEFLEGSTSGTTGSNVTLLSLSDFVVSAQSLQVGAFDQAGLVNAPVFVGGYFGRGLGQAAAVTTNNTMALSVPAPSGADIRLLQFINLSGSGLSRA